jgi:hypothetical protein
MVRVKRLVVLERPLSNSTLDVTHSFKSDKKEATATDGAVSPPAKWEIEITANGHELARYTVVPNSEHVVLHLKKSP